MMNQNLPEENEKVVIQGDQFQITHLFIGILWIGMGVINFLVFGFEGGRYAPRGSSIQFQGPSYFWLTGLPFIILGFLLVIMNIKNRYTFLLTIRSNGEKNSHEIVIRTPNRSIGNMILHKQEFKPLDLIPTLDSSKDTEPIIRITSSVIEEITLKPVIEKRWFWGIIFALILNYQIMVSYANFNLPQNTSFESTPWILSMGVFIWIFGYIQILGIIPWRFTLVTHEGKMFCDIFHPDFSSLFSSIIENKPDFSTNLQIKIPVLLVKLAYCVIFIGISQLLSLPFIYGLLSESISWGCVMIGFTLLLVNKKMDLMNRASVPIQKKDFPISVQRKLILVLMGLIVFMLWLIWSLIRLIMGIIFFTEPILRGIVALILIVFILYICGSVCKWLNQTIKLSKR